MIPSAVRCLAAALLIALPFSGPTSAQENDLEQANRLFSQGRLEPALERVSAYLRERPKDARGRFLRGLILAEQSRYDEAIRAFSDLTRDYPELPEPYNNLAVLYASRGRYDEARQALEMAIRTHPSYATAHENLGDIYAKMASQAYDKALALDRRNTTAQTKLNLIRDLFSGTPASSRPDRLPDSGRLASAAPPTRAQERPAPAAQPPEPAKQAAAAASSKAPRAEAPPPAPAPSPASTPAAASPSSREADVLAAVNEWAEAWSGNDVEAYLAHYASDFRTPKGEPRAQWEQQRRARIAKPRRIEVKIHSPRVTFSEDGRASVTFVQRYRSGSLNLSGTKTLEMVRSNGRWLIRQERIDG